MMFDGRNDDHYDHHGQPGSDSVGNNFPPELKDLTASLLNSIKKIREEESVSQLNLNDTDFDSRFHYDGAPDATLTVNGKDYICFIGDGYLGLQCNPEILSATCEAILLYGVSSATSRRHFIPISVLGVEKRAAQIFETNKAFYSASNQESLELLLRANCGTFERVFIDEGCADFLADQLEKFPLELSPSIQIRHRDPDDLRAQIKKHLQPMERPLFITHGVFPFFGTIAPISDYFDVLAEFDDASIMIDDSHGFGVLGEKGRGILEHLHYQVKKINQTKEDFLSPMSFSWDSFSEMQGNEVSDIPQIDLPIRTYWSATLSKAIGGIGGLIPGSDLMVERLTEIARTRCNGILSTPGAAATIKGLELATRNHSLQDRLRSNTVFFKNELKKLGLPVEENMIPIVGLRLGSHTNMRRIQKTLADNQILISYIPRKKEIGSEGILRITITANHTKEMLRILIDQLAQVL
ncbi:MAG: aminotransferase class I/II-fold pyridoxal phosphate-dependent enzyme [Planctomycetia bacterium]|nr:aminotransferase class I/II-fold pyridoxal phosphate-dependent enzyme [Planctomycetia bacterium]